MSRFACRCAALGAALALCAAALPAQAQTPLLSGLGGPRDYGTACLAPNDDGSSASIDLTPAFPAGLRFFTRSHMTAFVNTNGNITFSEPLPTFTPEAFPVADQPMIAPYWGDVDIRDVDGTCMGSAGLTCTVCEPCHNPTENGVWWHLEPGLMVVTWDQVGYYDCATDLRMNFQLLITAAEGCGGSGDFDVEFRYNTCEWHTGDASGGLGGVCDPMPIFTTCTPAQAGFDAGNLVDFVEIMGSRTDTIHTSLCTGSNVGEPGVWRFQIRSGTVVCPDAGDPCDTGMEGVCASGATQCVGGGTACQPIVDASEEVCDSLDNDCDGMVDDGDDICTGLLQECVRGVCVDLCFEGGCGEGQVCNADNQCVDAGCESVECGVGERCVGGSCVDACSGIICPEPQSCFAGRCQDLCMDLACDDCTVCEDGACVERCSFTGCDSGQTCLDDGRCVDVGCEEMVCPRGETCVGGSCQDSCIGAVCPPTEECILGTCQPTRELPDGGVPGLDAGPRSDGGAMDAGGGDAAFCPPGVDCTGGRDDEGCGCAAPGALPGAPAGGLAALGLLLLGLRLRRRR